MNRQPFVLGSEAKMLYRNWVVSHEPEWPEFLRSTTIAAAIDLRRNIADHVNAHPEQWWDGADTWVAENITPAIEYIEQMQREVK